MYIILDYKEVEIEFADEINRANIESGVRATLSEDMQNTRICGLLTWKVHFFTALECIYLSSNWLLEVATSQQLLFIQR